MKLPAVRSQLLWWAGMAAIVACIVSHLMGARAGTQGMWLVSALVLFERAW